MNVKSMNVEIVLIVLKLILHKIEVNENV